MDNRAPASVEPANISPQGPGYSTSSPSSLYAQRRKPNLPFRPEANRSTPSLLGQSSPPRRTSSPFVSSHNDISGHDWHRRTGPASMNTSPARSTFSLASTVNLCATVQPPSTATTPGKVPPSPLYYDYTEDFEVEVINPLVLDSPTPFRIDKTIPEDRPKSSGNLPSGARDLQRSADDLFRRLSHKESLPIAEFPIPGAGRGHTSPPLTSEVDSGTSTNDPSQDRKTFRLSGLGYGAQLLNSHVDEAFQLNPPSDLEIRDPNKVNEEGSAVGVADYERPSEIGNHIDQRSLRGFYSSARIPTFPAPPRTQALMSGNAVDLNSRPENGKAEAAEVSPALQPLGAAKAENNQCEDSKEISPEPIPSEAVPTASPINSIGVIPQKTTSESQFFPLTSSFSRRRAEDGQAIPKIPPLKRTQYYHGGRQLDYPATPDVNGGDVPNFSHQLPGKDMARSESPMLAPKPISPARQLKLKNSIPQLMKALPALPPEPTGRTVSPVVESPHSEGELPSNFTPLPRFEGSALSKEKPEVPDKDIPLARPITVAKDEKPTVRQNEVHPSHNIAEEKSTDLRKADAASHLKLKLKLKSPSQRPMSPPDSRPWNLAENYPWTAQTPSVRLPSLPLDSDPAAPKPPPRFKLRVTRASQSTQGTVRINRESTNARSFAGLPLGYPKDLFTPATGVDSIFRQVSKHFHSRRASATSNHTNQTHRTSASGPLTDLSSDADSPTSNRDVAHLPSIPAGHLHAPGARSVFSDDSSRVQGHHNLRKRLSHLKTRITHPYGAKTGAQSYDDITWKDRTGRNGGVLSTPSAARSIPNFHSNRHSTESKPMRRFGDGVQRQKLKVKVQGWLRGAKSKISARMRSRTAAVEMEADIPTKA